MFIYILSTFRYQHFIQPLTSLTCRPINLFRSTPGRLSISLLSWNPTDDRCSTRCSRPAWDECRPVGALQFAAAAPGSPPAQVGRTTTTTTTTTSVPLHCISAAKSAPAVRWRVTWELITRVLVVCLAVFASSSERRKQCLCIVAMQSVT